MSRSSFLAGLHAGFGVPRSVVVELAERVTGARVADVRRIVRGDENEVYRVALADGPVVYTRIRRPGARGADREAWAMDQARRADVPAPEVLAVEVVDAGEGEQQAMLQAEAPGRQLAGLLPSLSPEQRRAAMVGVGRVLARLHTVATPGVWRPDDDGVWPDPEDLHRGFVADRTAERGHLATAGLTADEIDRTLALLGKSPDTPARTDPVLCHGDLSPEHVFVDADLRVCGLIDWGLWHGGSALGELACVAMRHNGSDSAAVVDGHGAGSLDDPIFRRAIALSIVNQAVGHLAWHVSIGDTEGARPILAALRTALTDVTAGTAADQ